MAMLTSTAWASGSVSFLSVSAESTGSPPDPGLFEHACRIAGVGIAEMAHRDEPTDIAGTGAAGGIGNLMVRFGRSAEPDPPLMPVCDMGELLDLFDPVRLIKRVQTGSVVVKVVYGGL